MHPIPYVPNCRRWLWLGVVSLALVGSDAMAQTTTRVPTATERVEPEASDPVVVPAARGWNGQGAPTRTTSGRGNAGGGFNGGSFAGKRTTQAGSASAANPNPYASGQNFAKPKVQATSDVAVGNAGDYGNTQPVDASQDDSQTPTGYEQYATPEPDATPIP